MQFLVVVACAVGVACPLPSPLSTHVTASSSSECYSQAEGVIRMMNNNPKDFKVTCTRK